MRKRCITLFMVLFVSTTIYAQIKEFKVNDTWLKKIETLAPSTPSAKINKTRKLLVFDLHTGFNHWVIPHTSQVIKILGEKSNAFETTITNDISCFEKKNLKKYDAIVLNNTCSIGPKRDLLYDALTKNTSLSEEEKAVKVAELENNLLKYVAKGNGLMVVHGAIVMQNNSMEFSKMVGGSFDYHPAQQELTLELAEPNHPISKAFEGKPFVHVDEPYLFNKAYNDKNFRPLLYMDTSKLKKTKKPIAEKIKYVSWIKPHGKGRVFYVSPSHNAQSFEDSRLLAFFLNGAQYVLGDLQCDDSPNL